MKIIRKLYDWVLHWAHTPHGSIALILLSMAESIFFPVPPDPLLAALCLGKRKKSLIFALQCSIGSIIGGIIGYIIGYFFSDFAYWIFDMIHATEHWDKVQELFAKYSFKIVFAAGFTPIPYKVFTLGSGIMKIDFTLFIIASAISRSLRFFMVATLLYYFGEPIQEKIDKYFNLLTILFLVLLFGGLFIIKVIF